MHALARAMAPITLSLLDSLGRARNRDLSLSEEVRVVAGERVGEGFEFLDFGVPFT